MPHFRLPSAPNLRKLFGMKFVVRLSLLFLFLPAMLSFTGCKEPEEEVVEEEYWDPAWGPAPEGYGSSTGATGEIGPDGEPVVIQDTAYVVVEKRQAGGNLVPDGVSKFDGRPRMKRVDLECMIIVEGNQTGTRSAYMLPPSDYNVVQVGHALKESTLSRWDSTAENAIPPPPEPEPTQRSRTGGAAENLVY